MKKILSFLFVIVLSLCMAIAATAATEKNLSSSLGNSLTDDIIEKGFEYELMSGSNASEIAIYGFDADILGTDVVIPKTIHGIKVTHIYGRGVFGWKKLTSVTIPDSVTSIGEDTFKNCKKLTSVTIGSGVTSIGSGAFHGTAWYNSLPDGDVYIGKVYYKYKGTMPSNTSMTIKDGTKGIAGSAFSGCTGLTSITIPDSVISIGDYMFNDCTGLTKINWNAVNAEFSSWYHNAFLNAGTSGDGIDVVFGEKVKYIPSDLFYVDKYDYEDCKTPKIKTVTIGNSVTSIGKSAFYCCSNLASITIPDSVTSVGSNAFYRCSSLTSVTISDSMTSIGSSTFDGCTSLTSITIPDSVTSIGDYAFRSCTSLTSVAIPDSVTSIGSSAFHGTAWYDSQPYGDVYAGKVYYKYKGTVPSNTNIKIEDGTKGIADSAFEGCSSLVGVTIPDSVTSIGVSAFYRCPFTTLKIGKGLKSIGKNAFNGIKVIPEIFYTGSVAEWKEISIDSSNDMILRANMHYMNHTHSYTETVTKKATCTTNGTKTFTCDCGSTYTETIPAAGHKYVTETHEATCTSIGALIKKCESCGIIDSATTTPALGHTDEDNNGICDRCEEKLPDKEQHVHYYTVKTYVQPTCLSIGYEVRACSCGDTYTVTLPALGHTDEDNNGICDRCEEKLAAQPEEPTKPDTPSDDKNNDNAFVAFFKQIIELLKKLFNLLGKRA